MGKFLKILIFCFLLTMIFNIHAEKTFIVVGEGRLLPTLQVDDEIRDVEGKICAGIYIVSPVKKLYYNCQYGIIQKKEISGNDLVFVSPNETYIEIRKYGYNPLRVNLNDYKVNLSSGKVWQIMIGEDVLIENLKVTLNKNPKDAEVTLNETKLGNVDSFEINTGKHKITLKRRGFITQEQMIDVNSQQNEFTISLVPDKKIPVTIQSQPKGAELFLDGESYGKTNFNGSLFPDEYLIRLELPPFIPIEEKVVISNDSNDFDYKFKTDKSIFSLVGSYSQVDDVKLDQKILDKSGAICAGLYIDTEIKDLDYKSSLGITDITKAKRKDLLYLSPDENYITIQHPNYYPQKINLRKEGIILQRGNVSKIVVSSVQNVNVIEVEATTNLDDADIYIDNVNMKKQRKFYLTEGKHNIRAEKIGYIPIERNLNINSNNSNINLIFEKADKMSINVKTTPDKALLFIDGKPIGETDLATDVLPGTHEFRITKAGFHSIIREVYVDKAYKLFDFTLDASNSEGFVDIINVKKRNDINVDKEFVDEADQLATCVLINSPFEDLKYESEPDIIESTGYAGQDLLYLSSNTKMLEVQIPEKYSFKIFFTDSDINLRSGEAIEIELGNNIAKTEIPVYFNINPPDAEFFVDNQKFSGNKLSVGKHMVLIKKTTYAPFEREILVDELHNEFDFSLSLAKKIQIEVNSLPDSADVYLNDKVIGTTKFLGEVYAGEYTLKISKDGFDEYIENIIIDDNSKIFNGNLINQRAILIVDIQPTDALLYIDNKLQEDRKINIVPGEHTIEVKKEGYISQAKTVTFRKNIEYKQEYVLEALTGKLQLFVTPDNAETKIVRDGVVVKTFTKSLIKETLPVGEYSLTVSSNGYITDRLNVNIFKNETNALQVSLKKDVKAALKSNTKKKMILVEGGSFKMGDTFGDGEPNEQPSHDVKVSSFYMSNVEVTQKEWKEIMGNNPSEIEGDGLPVSNISWYNVVSYCNSLSEKENYTPCYTISGKSIECDFNANGYRLPTEAEWEFAAKGGKFSHNYKYSGTNDVEDYAWYMLNSDDQPKAVGTKKFNELKLYDLCGNVWEFCWDNYSADYYGSSPEADPTGAGNSDFRVVRGGSYKNLTSYLRSSKRYFVFPDHRDSAIGFRLVRSKK